jgi:hypothetical protein
MKVLLDKDFVESDLEMVIHDPEIDVGVSNFIYHNKCWEPYETSIFIELIRGKQCFVDVGANIGFHSLLAARIWPMGRKSSLLNQSRLIFRC